MCSLPLFGLSVFLSHWIHANAFTAHNTPPVFDFKRKWILAENEPVGSRIVTVRTRDEDGDNIEYGIEPALYVDGSEYFRINKDTGEVHLVKSFAGEAGNDFFLYITANDGHQTAKIEVYIQVLGPNASPQEPTIEVPFSTSRPPGVGQGHRFQLFPGQPRPSNAHIPSAPHPARPPAPPYDIPTKTIDAPKSANTTPATPSPPAVPAAGDLPPVRLVPPREGGGEEARQGVDVTSTILPVVGVTGLAPVLMLLLWMLHRRCKNNEKLTALKKASLARREGSLSDTVAFSYSPTALLRSHQTPPEPPITQKDITKFPNDQKWEFPRHRLQFLGILGEGCFGQVWKCEATNLTNSDTNSVVAVKTLKENATEKEKKDLLMELEVMKLLEPHPNVVTLLGCCSDRDPIFVIMEYVAKGKLQTYLRESRAERLYGNLHGSSKHLTSRDLTSFSYQVARGMEYLANKGIIHRDLAARNVLVDENKICKVADFGFARDVIASHVYERKSEGRLPIRWMAPESLFDNIYTTKTDVWSFGVLMWEIVTLGSTPYPGLSAAEVMRTVREGYRLDKPDHCRREMYNIMFYCWDKDPLERPSFSELVGLLDRLLLSEHVYIELERFPDHSYYNITDLSGEKL